MELTLNLSTIFWIFLALLGIIFLVVANAVVMVYVERKAAAFIQRRFGPYEVGPSGILQSVVDSIKLLGKQLFIPENGDKILFLAAPVCAFFPILLLFLTIPFGKYIIGLDINLGILLILAFVGFELLSTLLGGWASNNKYGLLGSARSVAQTIAYEIPLLLAILAVVMQNSSLSLMTIVEKQGSYPWQWNILTQPIAFFIYIISMFGETNRAPFDLPEAESELTAGFHTEYSGMGFGLFFLSEYASMLVVSFIGASLFLGGWKGPFLDGIWWSFIKAYAIMFFMVWVRWTYPRVRFDQLLNLNWKYLLPLALANLWLTALFIKVF